MEFDGQMLLNHIGTLIAAFILALPIGYNRERHSRSAGLRTFPLVCVASCGFMMIGLSLTNGDPAEVARIVGGVATGIGFIGGGTILKRNDGVAGLATAASLWNTAAIGVAVAAHRFEIAILLSVFNFAVLRFVTPMKDTVGDGPKDD